MLRLRAYGEDGEEVPLATHFPEVLTPDDLEAQPLVLRVPQPVPSLRPRLIALDELNPHLVDSDGLRPLPVSAGVEPPDPGTPGVSAEDLVPVIADAEEV